MVNTMIRLTPLLLKGMWGEGLSVTSSPLILSTGRRRLAASLALIAPTNYNAFNYSPSWAFAAVFRCFEFEAVNGHYLATFE